MLFRETLLWEISPVFSLLASKIHPFPLFQLTVSFDDTQEVNPVSGYKIKVLSRKVKTYGCHKKEQQRLPELQSHS